MNLSPFFIHLKWSLQYSRRVCGNIFWGRDLRINFIATYEKGKIPKIVDASLFSKKS